jgi:hypothetical protein
VLGHIPDIHPASPDHPHVTSALKNAARNAGHCCGFLKGYGN